LRQNHRDNRWLLWALVVSLLLHLAIWGGYELGKKQGWWERWPVFAWLRPAAKPVKPQLPQLTPAEQIPQLSFLTVAEPDPEPPKKPKFYSNNNSHAANRTFEPELNTPKLDGKQTDMVRTETAPRTHISKTQSQPEAKPTKVQAQPQEQPEKAQTQPLQPNKQVQAGDLTEGKPQEAPQQTEPPHPQRPRTIREALAQQPNQIQGLQMRQDGGVHNTKLQPAFDAKRTLFGDYDAELEQAIQQKWDDLLDARNFSGDCNGRVTIHFYLNYDGTITEASIVPSQTTVAPTWAYLCQQAVTAPAPYAKWPDQMRREIGKNVREMSFTFFYY
jgi:hypothetical protein